MTQDERLKQELEKIYQRADQYSARLIILSFMFGIFIAPIYETWAFAWGIGGLNLMIFAIAYFLVVSPFVKRILISIVFAVYMLQMIGQMHGMAEPHFLYFVYGAFLIIYQDWRIMIPYAILTVAHHTTFFYLQLAGVEGLGIYFINYTDVDYMVLGFHYLFVVAMAVICGLWAVDLRQRNVNMILTTIQNENHLSLVERGVEFAQQISKGELDSQYEIKGEQDILGQALVEMQKNLQRASEKEARERFINTGLSRLAKILQDYLNDLKTLGNKALKELVDYLELNQAALFVADEDESTGNIRLNLLSCYAYSRLKYIHRSVEINEFAEDMLAQAFMEKEMMYLKKVPPGYFNITSGLGETVPNTLIILPLKVNEEAVGVIEMAGLEELEEHKLEFLKKASESLAATISSAHVNARTQKLLRATQEQAEELKTQEEEMRQNMEELQSTQEAMRRKQIELEETNRKLMESQSALEKIGTGNHAEPNGNH